MIYGCVTCYLVQINRGQNENKKGAGKQKSSAHVSRNRQDGRPVVVLNIYARVTASITNCARNCGRRKSFFVRAS